MRCEVCVSRRTRRLNSTPNSPTYYQYHIHIHIHFHFHHFHHFHYHTHSKIIHPLPFTCCITTSPYFLSSRHPTNIFASTLPFTRHQRHPLSDPCFASDAAASPLSRKSYFPYWSSDSQKHHCISTKQDPWTPKKKTQLQKPSPQPLLLLSDLFLPTTTGPHLSSVLSFPRVAGRAFARLD